MPYSVSKAAKIAGVSTSTMYRWVKSGKVSAIKSSDGRYSIDEGDLEQVNSSRKQIMAHPVCENEDSINQKPNQKPLDLGLYKSPSSLEAKYTAALEAVTYEHELLRRQVEKMKQRAEAAEAAAKRSEAIAEQCHEGIKSITRLLQARLLKKA